MPFGLGLGETVLIAAVILLFFGPKRLPDAAASMGKGIREFKRAMSGFTEELTAPQDTASTPLPPHSTFVGTGADPYAVPADEPPASVAAAADAAEPAEPHRAHSPTEPS
ncbi:MAG TPA: twin-arginine translocase TatA/TatE family subunit [Longimicrobium sp.]|nr:twin-arginine translocase TatA/TatE family subunit [Longimicrobium sp.]